MRELYPYYERELGFMRDMAGEFARNYPHTAARLDLERYRCDDPHVERLIEAFCLIAARIHHRLDADFPEVTQALLNVIYPHYLRPLPAMSIMQFAVARSEWERAEPIYIPRSSEIDIGEDLSRFHTCYPVDLWPIRIASAAVLGAAEIPDWGRKTGASGGILIELEAGRPFSQLKDFDTLRFYLAGAGHTPFTIHELLFSNCEDVALRSAAAREPIILSRDNLNDVGFAVDDGVLPYDHRSFLGLRLLHEYFSFPNKFLFFGLGGLGAALRETAARQKVEILFRLGPDVRQTPELSSLRLSANADNFLLGCSPVVNLFSRIGEQIKLDHTRAEYQVIPDNDREKALEVYSVDSVVGRTRGTWETRTYQPFFSFGHASTAVEIPLFWHSTRRLSRKGIGTEVFLSVVDPNLRLSEPADEILDVKITCTNRNLPAEIAFPLTFGELSLGDSRIELRFIHSPTKTLSPPVERDLDWRIISMLGLNYLTLANGGPSDSASGAEALQELLALYNFSEEPAIMNRIRALRQITSFPIRSRMTFSRGKDRVPVFCHGLAVELDLDADAFGGSGPFLFTSILERFFALYSPVNSFSQLTAHLHSVESRRRAVWQWKPRTGERVLL